MDSVGFRRFRLEKRLSTRAGLITVGSISFGKGVGRVGRGHRLSAHAVDTKSMAKYDAT